MTELFLTVLNMSIIASYVALAVIIVRLFLKKAPKIFSYALWAIVLFRLVSPFTLESSLSLVPSDYDIIPQEIIYSQNLATNNGITNKVLNNTAPSLPVGPNVSMNLMDVVIEIAAIVWLIGIAVLLGYGIISFIRLKQNLNTSTIVKDNVFETDQIKTPFVLGILKPRIYIPTGLREKELDYILKHEKIHIKRRDYIIKPVAFLALILHWFNPLIWICYYLMVKDMEMSCDESVMKHTNTDIRGSYSESLLSFSIKQSGLLSPLAFGESNVKSRIKNVLNYRKPAFWVIITSVFVVIIVAVVFLTNPKDSGPDLSLLNVDNALSSIATSSDAIVRLEDNSLLTFKPNAELLNSFNQIRWKEKKVNSPIEAIPSLTFYIYDGYYINLYSYEDIAMINCADNEEKYRYYNIPEGTYEAVLNYVLQHGVSYFGSVNFSNEVPLKGLELYVWKNKELTGNNDTYYTLLIGTNRNKMESEIYDLNIAVNSIEELNQLLAVYSDVSELFIYQMNTVDFTKAEMSAIADKINFPSGNGVKAIGLWQNGIPTKYSAPVLIADLIEKNLEIIMSSPLYSSRPGDYINAHREEYENILKQGDNALNYLLSQFEKGANNDLRGHIMMLLCKDLLGDRNNVKDETLSPQEWYNALSIIEETILPDFKYSGKDPIEKLVYDTEIERNRNPYRGGFIVVAPKIHAYYEVGNKLKVFVTTYSSSYHLYGEVLSVDSGGIVPAAITYVKNENGSYSLEMYEQAMDGAGWSDSIDKFSTMPISGEKIEGLADIIINHYGDYNDIIVLQRENLIQHLKINNQSGIKIKLPTGVTEKIT